MDAHMALGQTRRKLRPNGIGITQIGDDKYRLFSLARKVKDRIVACPEMAYIVGLRMSKEAALA